MRISPLIWLSELTRRNTLLAIFVVLVSLAAGIWSFQNVRRAVQGARATMLTGLLDTQTQTLAIWAAEKEQDTVRWAREPSIASLTERLLDPEEGIDHRSPGHLRIRSAFRDRILPAVEDLPLAAANIASLDGILIASLSPEYIGAKLNPRFLQRLQTVLDGRAAFIGPTLERDRLRVVPAERANTSVVWTAAPIRSQGGKVIAILCLGQYSTGHFARILEAARPGESGETYAFDSKGALLTPSRFEVQLRRLHVLGSTSPFVPGTLPLWVGGDAGDSSPHKQLTTLVQRAIAGVALPSAEQRGIFLTPYRNYIGTSVIGAWRWIPGLEFGIAIEVAEKEAYAPITFVTTHVLVLLLTLTVVVFLGPLIPPLLWRRFIALKEGDRLGSYRLLRKIDEGGLSEIYEAVHDILETKVAVKVVKRHLREEIDSRLEREGRLLASLDHPLIVRVKDAGYCEDGRPYYVMDLTTGRPLSRVVAEEGPLDNPTTVSILKQICEIVEYLKDFGVTHRDLSPNNILLQLSPNGTAKIKLIDFGLAKSLIDNRSMGLTREVSLMGTLGYLAPERIRNPESVDVRGDVYAVGAIGYFLLTGKEILPDVSNLAALRLQIRQEITSIDHEFFASVLGKAMSVAMSERYQSCAELSEALTSVLANGSETATDSEIRSSCS